MRKSRAAAIIALCAWGGGISVGVWGRTGDILGDFGHELYVAWQLSQGKVIARDVAYLCGPLSPWVNAMAMRMFGPELAVILTLNLLVLTATAILLYKLVLESSNELAAFAATAYFISAFGLGAATRITNYNFLTPYAHGLTHGFLLCLAMIACLIRFERVGGVKWAAAAGLLAGLAFLTKPEILVASAAIFVGGFLGAFFRNRGNCFWRDFAIAVVALVIAPTAAWVILRASMPPSDAFHAVFGGWQFVTPDRVMRWPLYLSGMGIDDVGHSLKMIALSTGVDIAAVLALIALARILPNGLAPLIGIAMCAAVVAAGWEFPLYWIDADRGLALFAIAAVAITGWRLVRGKGVFAQWMLAVFSLSLLAKMILNVRTVHYGFVLAAPCSAMLVAGLVDWLPAFVRSGRGVIRIGGLGLVAGLVINRLLLTNMLLNERTVPIPLAMGGQLQARPLDEPAAQAVRWLGQSPAGATALICPDAAGIDFAVGRSSGIAFNVLNPMTVSMWGEVNILRALERHPPDIILIQNMDTTELGASSFGVDYAQAIMQWIRVHYRPTQTFGDADAQRSIQAWEKN